MQKIATKVAKRIKKSANRKIVPISEVRHSQQAAVENYNTVNETAKLIEEGFDPSHAALTNAQNIVSVLIEGIIDLPELTRFANLISITEEAYMPSMPPMSSVTYSYFSAWSMFDVKIGVQKESLGSILLDLGNCCPTRLKLPTF